MATRRKFSQEYKQEAAQLAQSGEQSVSQVARELGLNPNMLSRWCRELKVHGQIAFPGVGKPRDEEMTNLKCELVRVKKERDFLQEAAAFFARASR